ncbi:MAG: TonB-dependent receptor [Betaproteobacteria bacterium]|nr:TonB-dependent receptor [Betaproteobacteria bacterium]
MSIGSRCPPVGHGLPFAALALVLTVSGRACAQTAPRPDASAHSTTLPTVVVTGRSPGDAPARTSLGEQDLAALRATTTDSARLLQDLPGVSLYGAGGISSLPVLHGLADDRLNILVDGAAPMSACPNHMNSALSYVNPTKVHRITVLSGIAPVSAGGDNIGGTVQVESAPPEFAVTGEGLLARGRAGAFYRSNGDAHGHDVGATLAGERLSVTYDESSTQSHNHHAGAAFKPAAIGSLLPGGAWIEGDEVASSAWFGAHDRELGIATQQENHLVQLNVSEQTVGFEGFPNQRMDMTANRNTLVNVRYTGQFGWGALEARVSTQRTRHGMDMGTDRFSYGTGMPMESKAATHGASIRGDIDLSPRDILRVGGDLQLYSLDDWWPPVGTAGSMCCDTFWNVRDGRRNRVGAFAEWETRWASAWTGLVGIRGDLVRSDAGDAAGYSTSGMWSADAARFNTLDHSRLDHHWGFSALVRQEPRETLTLEAGYARKTRSPSLYERYAWSTQAMAALMNNFAGDGNGYIGDVALKPETANTFSVSGDWHDADGSLWGLKATTYVTYVDGYIDARRCDFGQCGGSANVARTTGFVLLQYANQSARLYGIDLSGHSSLGEAGSLGTFGVTTTVNYVRGENRTTGDDLYHIMPLNAVLGITQAIGAWRNTVEIRGVSAKTHVSRVRNEVPTPGYGLVNLRTSYAWRELRIDASIENVFDRFNFLPLGGAYLGQGPSMTLGGIPWGITVPGPGRSLNVALNVRF